MTLVPHSCQQIAHPPNINKETSGLNDAIDLWSQKPEIEKSILKFTVKNKRSKIANLILSKKSNATSSTIPDFKLHYRARVTKTVWY
jgi:hypothetical protein